MFRKTSFTIFFAFYSSIHVFFLLLVKSPDGFHLSETQFEMQIAAKLSDICTTKIERKHCYIVVNDFRETSHIITHLNNQLRAYNEWINNEGSQESLFNAARVSDSKISTFLDVCGNQSLNTFSTNVCLQAATSNDAPELFPQSQASPQPPREPQVTVRRDEVEGHFSRPIRIPLPSQPLLISATEARSTLAAALSDHGSL